jgi:hypothetical protein
MDEQTLPDVIGATLMLTLAMQKLGRTVDEIVEVTNRATVFINEFWAINGYCPVPSDIILGLGLEDEVTVLCPGCGVRMDISDMGWICTLCWLRRPW